MLKKIELDFNKINNLVALNNYGKSNIIKGINLELTL